MNEPKPEDVMKALECCVIQCAECRKCPMMYRKDNRGTCYTELKRLALALLCEKDAEIERLEDLLRETAEYNEAWVKDNGDLRKALKTARAEAITEFAERLKNFYRHLKGTTASGSVEYHIDQVAKEMKGEDRDD